MNFPAKGISRFCISCQLQAHSMCPHAQPTLQRQLPFGIEEQGRHISARLQQWGDIRQLQADLFFCHPGYSAHREEDFKAFVKEKCHLHWEKHALVETCTETRSSCALVRAQTEAVTTSHRHLSQCHKMPGTFWFLEMGNKTGRK